MYAKPSQKIDFPYQEQRRDLGSVFAKAQDAGEKLSRDAVRRIEAATAKAKVKADAATD